MEDLEREMLLIAQGNELAFNSFMNRYMDGLYYHSYGILYNKEMAEEIVSDVFLEVWKNRKKIMEVENMKAWLNTLIYRKSISYLRKEKILAAFENLGFNLEDNESLGFSFNYEGINYLYMYNEDDEDFLNISVPGIYDLEEDNKENYDALKEKINSTLKYVKAYTLGKGLWLFYERDLLGNEDLEEVIRHMILHLAAALMFARDSIEKIDNGESDEGSDNDNND